MSIRKQRGKQISEHDSEYIKKHGIEAYLKYRKTPLRNKVNYSTIYEKDYHKNKAALQKKRGQSKMPRMKHGSKTKIGLKKAKRISRKISNRVRIGKL